MKELKSVHRILMTGTPINNNIREIFNLLNYLDPEKWDDLAALENKYDPDNLTDALIKELHELLRPYFLRRVKSDVMKDLPRKVRSALTNGESSLIWNGSMRSLSR